MPAPVPEPLSPAALPTLGALGIGLQVERVLLLLVGGGAQLVVEHLPRDRQEHVLHVDVVFGGCLVQLDVHLFREPLRVLGDDHLPVRIIVLVAHCWEIIALE